MSEPAIQEQNTHRRMGTDQMVVILNQLPSGGDTEHLSAVLRAHLQ